MITPVIAVWLSVVGVMQDPEAAIEAELAALEAAWRGGQVAQVAVHAGQAVALIEDSACPLRGDVTIAAFMGALANNVRGTPGSPSYLFWVASQTNAALDVLPEAGAEVADLLRSEPGQYVLQDSLFLRSPYRGVESLQVGCAQPQLDPFILQDQPGHATHAVAALRADVDREGEAAWTSMEVIFAYPAREAAQLIARVRTLEGRARPREAAWVAVFEPCERFATAELTSVELCREGAAP